MNLKIRLYLLGFYDLFLAIGAVYLGRELLNQSFQDWILSGIATLIIFGVGNLIASMFCFLKQNYMSWLLSAVLGSVLYILLVIQTLQTGDWQLSTVVFFALSILQLFFSRIVYLGYKKKEKRYCGVRSYI